LFRYENLKNKSNRYETKNRITNKSYFNTLDDKALNQLDEIEKKLFYIFGQIVQKILGNLIFVLIYGSWGI